MKLRTRLLALTMLTLAFGRTAFCAAGDVLFAHATALDGRQRVDARLTATAATLSLTARGGIRQHQPVNDQTLDSLVWIFAPPAESSSAPRTPCPPWLAGCRASSEPTGPGRRRPPMAFC